MAKTAKEKKGAASSKNKFNAEDKVFAMDGGDLYEAKVGQFQISTHPTPSCLSEDTTASAVALSRLATNDCLFSRR